MKNHHAITTLVFLASATTAFSQGALSPTTSPAPSMKTLQEIWDKLSELDERVSALEDSAADEASTADDALTGLGEILGATTRYNWSVSTIDASSDNVGKYASLAFNGNKKPAIAYFSTTANDLLFIEEVGTTWRKETIDSSGSVGSYCSLAFSDDGHAGIAYHDESDDALNFAARYDGTSTFLPYRVKTPDASQIWGRYNSLAFAPNGRPYIAHREQNALKIYLTYLTVGVTATPGEFTSANWNTVSLMGVQGGMRPSLDIRSDGRWGITHGLPGSSYNLEFVEDSSSGFSYSNVDSAPQTGNYSSLRFDSANKPGVAYYDSTAGTLKYSYRGGGAWTTVTVDSTGNVGQFCSLAFTRDDRPAIAYYDVTNQDLKYAERNSDGTWKTATVDSAGDVGQYASLALGRFSRPAIAYYDETNGDLKYAEATSKTFTAKIQP
jgi:hypothetical protein